MYGTITIMICKLAGTLQLKVSNVKVFAVLYGSLDYSPDFDASRNCGHHVWINW